jgi:RNA polymerase sigma-70 factor (ECF subfamily)
LYQRTTTARTCPYFASSSAKGNRVALSDIDRQLIERCLGRKPRAWEDFVDRFLGLVIHVINHTAQARSLRLPPEDREDLCSEVFLTIVKDDFALLRHFRGQSSLATYLCVVARRVVVRNLLQKQANAQMAETLREQAAAHHRHDGVQRVTDRDEVERMLEELAEDEARIVRMYHLEGKTYREISAEVGMPENTVGPTLTRARDKMRRASADGAKN